MLIDLKQLDVITPARPIRKVRGSVFPLFFSILAANGAMEVKLLSNRALPDHVKISREMKTCLHSHCDALMKLLLNP